MRELALQDSGEELVVPVALPPVVERDQEDVSTLELGQAVTGIRALGDRVANGRREELQDRRLKEETPLVFVEKAEDDLGQVVDDMAVRTVETGDELDRVRRVSERKRREVDTCGPALRLLVQQRERSLVETETETVVQEGGLLLRPETEVDRPQLDELSRSAQPSHGNRRVRSARQDELDVRGLRLHEEYEGVMAALVRHELVVVEQDHELFIALFELMEDQGDERVANVHVRRVQRDLEIRAEARPHPPDRLHDPGPEHRRVVVELVQREPGERSLLQLAPLGEQ